MGRLEKIVVLTVLFLVAVVLGVALNSDGPSAASGSRGAGAEPGKPALQSPEGPGGTLNAPLDDSSLKLDPKAPEIADGPPVVVPPPGPIDLKPEPAPSAPAPYTVTQVGLTPSNTPELMFYTWQAGDTLAGVAQRYYGSKDKLTRLQKANEGLTDASLKPGDQIWVQVAATPSTPPEGAGETHYVVKKGDVLSGISQKFYGTAKKWQKILDANQDTLSSPEKLRVGMKLRIPE